MVVLWWEWRLVVVVIVVVTGGIGGGTALDGLLRLELLWGLGIQGRWPVLV